MKLGKLIGAFAAALCMGMIVTVSASAQTYQPTATATYEGHTYALFDVSMKWTAAQSYCESIGGHLATVTSSFENYVLESLVSRGKKDAFWLGGTDYGSEGRWRWVTGEAWTYSNWMWGEPSNYRYAEHYLEIYRRNSEGSLGEWNDNDNAVNSVIGFICEWDAPMVQFPTFRITVNGVVQNNAYREYPFILYRNITYFPMTFEDCRSLGITNVWNSYERSNRIYTGGPGSVYYAPRTRYSNAFSSAYAQKAPNAVYVNDAPVYNDWEEYPILLYKNVLYFPLTWDWITRFGWNYSYDIYNGLSISAMR